MFYFLLINFSTAYIIGTYYLLKTRNEHKIYFMIFLSSLFLWFAGTSITGALPTHNLWRTGLAWNILLIPFVAEYILRRKELIGAGLFILVILLSLNQLRIHTKDSYMTKFDIEAGNKLQELNGSFIMPQYGWEFLNLEVASGKPENFVAKKKLVQSDLSGKNYLILRRDSLNPDGIWQNDKWQIYKIVTRKKGTKNIE